MKYKVKLKAMINFKNYIFPLARGYLCFPGMPWDEASP